MLMMAENLSAEDALAAGFLMAVVEPAALDQRIAEICERLKGNAPVTMRVTKEAIRRLQQAGLPTARIWCAPVTAAKTSATASRRLLKNARHNGVAVDLMSAADDSVGAAPR